MEDILTEKENIRVTGMVMDLTRMPPGEERDRLREELIERTELLIFLVPMDRGYLSREDASGFYLEQKKNAPMILDAYKVTRLLYNDYIAQVLRKRCINYTVNQKRCSNEWVRLSYIAGRQDIERSYTANESAAPYLEGYGGTLSYHGEDETVFADSPTVPYSCLNKERNTVDRSDLDLKDIINIIRKSRADGSTSASYGEEELRKRLEDGRMREFFLELMLYIPDQQRQDLSDHLSRVLGVKAEILDRFFNMRNELTGNKAEKIAKDRYLANRHFRLMIRMDTAMMMSENEKEKERLLCRSKQLREAQAKRIDSIKRLTHGLSQRQIAEIMGVSRSLVSVNLSKARAMLEETVGKVLLHSEDPEDNIIPV